MVRWLRPLRNDARKEPLMLPEGNSRKECECTACGQLFTTVANFDRHQGYEGEQTRCYPPTWRGMAPLRHASDGRPVYGQPRPPEDACSR